MAKAIKAALLSALVFPGIGHFFLKKPMRGILLAGTAGACLYLLISATIERALQITDKIQRGEVQPDIAAITELVLQQNPGAENQLINIASVFFIICWLMGIVDSYRVARVEERQRRRFRTPKT